MMLALAFLALSPRPYIRMPQPTAQYVHVLRVSVVRNSLYWRTSARAGAGEKPIRARLDPASVLAETFRNCRRDIRSMSRLGWFEMRGENDYRGFIEASVCE